MEKNNLEALLNARTYNYEQVKSALDTARDALFEAYENDVDSSLVDLMSKNVKTLEKKEQAALVKQQEAWEMLTYNQQKEPTK